MTATPQPIEKKYARLKITLTILSIVFVLFLLMTLVYGKIQRSLAIRFEERVIQLEKEKTNLLKLNDELQIRQETAMHEAQEARRIAEENLKACKTKK